jgi:hypothetical protein
MPRLRSQQLSRVLLRVLGAVVVTVILAFVLLPALVVTLAAFNGRAILSFPPETWSWRWFAKAIAYEDFQAGFRNGLIVTAWASSIALVVGAAFAIALDRYEFRLKRVLEMVLLSPLVVPHFTVGLGFLSLAARSALRAAMRSSSPAMSCWCCRSSSAASTSRCATSISDWSSPPRASVRRPTGFSSPLRCRCSLPAWSAAGCSRRSCHSTSSPPRCSSPRSARRRCRSRSTTTCANTPIPRWRQSR